MNLYLKNAQICFCWIEISKCCWPSETGFWMGYFRRIRFVLNNQVLLAVTNGLEIELCLGSIDHSLQLDHDAHENLDSMIVPCCGELRELKGGHYHKIIEITENAGKTLLNDYTVSFLILPQHGFIKLLSCPLYVIFQSQGYKITFVFTFICYENMLLNKRTYIKRYKLESIRLPY
ncbi:hypothetical protein HanHA300_Chr12g0457571 [Helianthus annuus]|nr:hypothetical protein HanHA300_Chr12g0457571 [Helianthus annuus]KAJ0506539.1 hypothetical protein HanHA89_Chr12g0483151 [Helianthus annuus]KAJ0676215.1 hypothetical protein HanLR1_Chr12g0460131 [Helianthus annuus]KAJ0679442.1 hypothetical protein HanOQP8_Chr12g0459481 [Helianthus annuus]